jgi:hypothetical protein
MHVVSRTLPQQLNEPITPARTKIPSISSGMIGLNSVTLQIINKLCQGMHSGTNNKRFIQMLWVRCTGFTTWPLTKGLAWAGKQLCSAYRTLYAATKPLPLIFPGRNAVHAEIMATAACTRQKSRAGHTRFSEPQPVCVCDKKR